MASLEKVTADNRSAGSNETEQWLDKLWALLFDGENAGLMSPGQIRRERRDRDRVRQLEMQAILQAETDINGIHQGTKTLDDKGNLVDTPTVEAVATHRVIENTAIENNYDLGLETPASMIRSVVREVSVRDLERSLNIRKIAILAESEILASERRSISTKPVNAEWMVRWRESAENVFHAEAQLLWARMLINELARPGSYAPGTLLALQQLDPGDLEILGIVSKYAFPDFIYDARQYFDPDTHGRWFEVMEELGLLSHSSATLDLYRQPQHDGFIYLPCGRRAIRVSGVRAAEQITLPVFKLTRMGRQLLPLVAVEADVAYMAALGRQLKSRGCAVELGEWHPVDGQPGGGQFTRRMTL